LRRTGRSPDRWCALTAPFHPYPSGFNNAGIGRAVCLCGTFRRVAAPGRYPAPCPLELGLSSLLRKEGERPPVLLTRYYSSNEIPLHAAQSRGLGWRLDLFNARDHERVVRGDLTVTWRLWKYAHVKAGRVYPTGFGGGHAIDDVREVRVTDITDADAQEAGLADAATVVELARAHTGAQVSDDTIMYRVQFHYVSELPAKPALPLEEISRRLQRLDQNSRWGAWTEPALRIIEENPGVVSTVLAAEIGQPRAEFKTNVRKLKALGLTISLEVGYELSELGQTYLDSLEEA
jgi:hypothetical protein